MKKTILIFGTLIFALLMLFQISKYSLVSGSAKIEVVMAIVAIAFFIVGVFLNKKSFQKKHSIQSEIDLKKIESLQLSKREYEVLKEIESGLSNKEIGEQLFLSESTVKTHVSNLFVKLNAKRRTQALQKAKALQII